MRSLLASLSLSVLLGLAAGVQAETPNKPKGGGEAEPLAAQNLKWLELVNRLRDNPWAGEIIVTGRVTAQVTDIYEFKKEDKAKVAELQKAYSAELLQKAAKWEEELNTLRAEYENKITALLPEEKRDPARKLLDYSHTRWAADCNYNLAVELGIQKLPETLSEEQQKARSANIAWIKQQREKQRQEIQETLKTIRALLSPEESARFDKLNKAANK